MSRLTLLLVALIGLLVGGTGVLLLRPPPQGLDEAQVRAIFGDMLATEMAAEEPVRQSVAVLDPATLNPMIEDFLMGDPAILDRMSAKLSEARLVAKRAAQREIIQANYVAIFNDPADVVIGNPQGDVTLVEMFDYNCSYCRTSLPDIATLLAEDPNLRVILKEFPILSEGSIEAARVAVLVNGDKSVNYWDFHQQLFSSRGQVTGDTALDIAEQMGMSRTRLMIDMAGTGPGEALSKVYNLARALDVSGTPTFIIGDELIPGAIGIEKLRDRIANMRACGSTVCPAETAG